MAKFLKVCLIEPRSVVAVYDSKPDYEDSDHHKIVEYNYDDSTEDRRSLVVAPDGSVTNKHTGKSKAEAQALNEVDAIQFTIDVEKERVKKRINSRTIEKLEAIDWKTQKAKEQDYLAGTTDKSAAVAAEKQAIRDDGNAHEAGVDALTTFAEVAAYSDKPPAWGKNTEWTGITWDNS
tara:strand:+ start:4628 stop:5161 length:534 start_codon:yes stop_codon:yes gene_type:complete